MFDQTRCSRIWQVEFALKNRELVKAEVFEKRVFGKGPPFHGSRSSREIKIQNASCQMGGREVTR